MNGESRRKYEQGLLEEAECIMEEVNNNPELKDVTVPSEIRDNIFNAIREKEEEKELIRLGKIYKRKRKNQKYFVLAAAMVLALAFGITSFGDSGRIYGLIKRYVLNREQINLNSEEDIEFVTNLDEELVYEEIEEKFGFTPVKLEYRPERVEFKEASIGDEIQGIMMIYGQGKTTNIMYFIRPNYRTSSFGTDVEDQLLEQYNIEIRDVELSIKKYQVEETQTERWSAEFIHGDVGYFLIVSDIEQEEFEKIIKDLIFV